jgi:hypothetical protein
MPALIQPFPLPRKLPKKFANVLRYWKALIRAENPIPFSDDVKLSQLSGLSGNLLLIDVFAKPQRFRFNYLGEHLIRQLNSSITGKFADEFELHSPLDFFISQSSATVEARTPTWYSCSSIRSNKSRAVGYSRIMLPTWGDGRVELLLGAIM